MANYEFRLPLEQWRQVLMNNSHADLCNVMLASRHMNSVASLPELWAGMKVNIRKVLENGLAEFYNINRFKKVKHIDLERFEKFKNIKWEKCKKFHCEELERLLKEITGSPLERANLCWQDLSGVSAELLACALSHLHNVNLSETHLTTNQCVAVFKASLSSTTLINLNLKWVNLSGVSAELLANSISRFHEVNLCQTDLTTDQSIALLKASLSSATLTNINLKWVNLSKVPADVLANSISRLQEVNVCRTNLTTEQCIALLKASLSSATLKKINLKNIFLDNVPADLLANSISRLQEVNLCGTFPTTEQCFELLKASLSSKKLIKIKLEGIFLDKIPADLLANSISRFQEVNLCQTDLKSEQCIALLKASLSSATLTNVNLDCVDLSEVPAELLANSISRLQEVSLYGTDLTIDQSVALLNANLSSTILTNIHMKEVKLSEFPAEVLANSTKKIWK